MVESKAVVFVLLVVIQGCATSTKNAPLKRYDPQAGYRFQNATLGKNNTDGLFVFVAFSGGGTRAAALAYGALEGLASIEIPPLPESDAPRSLLDEVDGISSVPGGSFTAMGYALWREDFFDGRFMDRFLKHNVQRDLALSALLPPKVFVLPFQRVDKLDVAAEYYNRYIFEGHTYADLMSRGTRPFVYINATDMTRTQTFGFTQENFNLLGSDLSALPVGTAVAASSAYPLLLSPLRLRYHHGPQLEEAVAQALQTSDENQLIGRRHWAETLLADRATTQPGHERHIGEKDHKYLFLLDGGIADNIGLHSLFAAYGHGPIRDLINAGKIRRFLVVIVDAGKEQDLAFERRSSAPGALVQGLSSASGAVNSNSMLMTAVTKYLLMVSEPRVRQMSEAYQKTIRRLDANADQPPSLPESKIEDYVLDVNVQNVLDPERRREFSKIATSFSLPDYQVDLLVEEGRRQIANHPELLRLIRDLRSQSDATPENIGPTADSTNLRH